MIIDVNSTPSYVLGDLVARYDTAQLDQAAEVMSLYLEEEGKPLLNLFMEPETRMLASDVTNLLRKMSEENLHMLIDMIDDHIGKTYADEAQAEEAEYHSDVMNWVSQNPESWRI